jgi:hypothetical protein
LLLAVQEGYPKTVKDRLNISEEFAIQGAVMMRELLLKWTYLPQLG